MTFTIILLFLNIPVFVSVLTGSMTYFLHSSTPPQIIVQRLCAGLESVPLLAVPFFVCTGVFMNSSGVTKRIMDFCYVLTKRLPGGLAQVNILLSTFMGGLSGSALADSAMQSKMLVPEMEAKGMHKGFSTVVTAFSSCITPLIPPGIGMILYGSIANVSIGKLFVAGISVGIFLCMFMMIVTHFIAKKRGYVANSTDKMAAAEFWAALKKAIIPLCLPIIIIGGIRIGVFTPTEAGAIAILFSLILGFMYKELNLQRIVEGIKETMITTAAIMLIVGAASTFAWVLTKERIPQELTQWMISHVENKYIFLLLVNLFLLVVGMFIEGNAATIVLVPLLAPIAAAYGINEIQFAFVFIFNMAVGAITPPMGTLMFVTCGITGCKMKEFQKAAIPYYGLMIGLLLLITFVQWVTTGLVNLIY